MDGDHMRTYIMYTYEVDFAWIVMLRLIMGIKTAELDGVYM